MTRRYDRPAILLAALAAAFPPLYGWAVRSMLRRNLARLWAGDPEPLLAAYAEDIHFVFPGRSSWAADVHGKQAVRRWLERFVRVGLRFEVHEILVEGPRGTRPRAYGSPNGSPAPTGRRSTRIAGRS